MIPIVILYVWSFPYFELLNSPNEVVRLYMTIAIGDHGSYDIEPVCRRYTWVNDRSVVGDRAYSSKAPGASLAAVPFYLMAKGWAAIRGSPLERSEIVRWLRLTVCVIPALVFLFAFRRFTSTLGYSPFVRDAVFVGTALGTPAFTYVHQFAGHVPAACSLFGAYIVLDGARRRGGWSAWRSAWFGCLLATAPVMDYQALVPGLVVGGAFLLERASRRPAVLLPAVAGGALPLSFMAHFHWSAFGSPLRTGYAFIENPGFQMMLSEGWMGLTYPHIDRLIKLLVSTDNGLFFYSPFLLFGLLVLPLAPALWRAAGRDSALLRHVVVSAGVVVTLVLFIASNISWSAGWTAGPRYLTPLMPFASLLALVGLGEADRIWGAPARAAALTCVLLAVFFSGVSGAVYPHLPVAFVNPIFEVLVPMLRDGFLPGNLGYDLGLRGVWGYVPALVLGLAPLLAWLCVASSRTTPGRASILASAVLAAALFCQPFADFARRAAMPPWGINDLQGVYVSWHPADNIAYFERCGCTIEDGNIWRMTCRDRIAKGRVLMRLGLKHLAVQYYHGGGGQTQSGTYTAVVVD
ncbi:MAG: hypothetical protein JRG91_00380 [Deltaproteobacteria bacterium]|nr:hypothetical protein [Deltaproteobacteria bacterium]